MTYQPIPVAPAPADLPPHKIAFVIDGEVVDVMHTHARLAAILLSKPTIVDITDIQVENYQIMPGFKYNTKTKTFTIPTVGA
jgi:hypothetical protein